MTSLFNYKGIEIKTFRLNEGDTYSYGAQVYDNEKKKYLFTTQDHTSESDARKEIVRQIDERVSKLNKIIDVQSVSKK